MNEHDVGLWGGIVEVASGRGQFRLILQPLIAIILGVADAKEGRAPLLLRLFKASEHCAQIAKAAALDVIIPFSVAMVVDGILQYPVQSPLPAHRTWAHGAESHVSASTEGRQTTSSPAGGTCPRGGRPSRPGAASGRWHPAIAR